MPANWEQIVADAVSVRPTLALPRNFKLPCIPQSVIEFTAISKDPNAGPRELAAPIEVDAALTSGLMRQVNSTALGVRQAIVSVKQAINLLGPKRTKTLVLTTALQTATAGMTSRLINTNQFQKMNRIRADFARRAAREIGADAEAAYLAGLLQDFMLPILTEAFHVDYIKALEPGRELVQQEMELFGWHHAQVGAMVMYDWGFPAELVNCVLLHHDEKRVLADRSLLESSVGATVASACLPDSFWESPTGFDTLLAIQEELCDFNPLAIAAEVDQELLGIDPAREHPDSLYDKLSGLAEERLELRRVQRVTQRRQVGSYILESQIGEGAMGVIYRARHGMMKRAAAIKVLRNANITPAALAMFESEVQLTCQLSSPNTVALYDYGSTPEGLFYYAMEYLEGETLASLIREVGPIPEGRVIHFLTQVCASLGEAHQLGLIHRDLKPENLMVCQRGGVADFVKVLDFGVAIMMSSTPDPNQAAVGISGTPCYMSPEAITAPQTLDGRSDLYSLGAIGYFLLTGQSVFPMAEMNAVLRSQLFEIPARPSAKLGRPVDSDLEDVILKCLEKSRDKRPATADELCKMLGQCRASGSWHSHDALLSLPRPAPLVSPTVTDLESDTVVNICPTDDLGSP